MNVKANWMRGTRESLLCPFRRSVERFEEESVRMESYSHRSKWEAVSESDGHMIFFSEKRMNKKSHCKLFQLLYTYLISEFSRLAVEIEKNI